MIARDLVCDLLDYDPHTGIFTWRKTYSQAKAGATAGQVSTWGYIRIPIMGKKYTAHQLAWLIFFGEWPSKQIDHIDGDKKNNAIKNLRLVTPSLNQLYNDKPRKGNKTGLLGVSMMGKKFKAQIKVDGVIRHLGSFTDKESAHAAYQVAKRQILAERARSITTTPAAKEQS